MTGRVGVATLAAMRIAIGGMAWVAPEAAARLFGFGFADANAQGRYLWRLFGVRDVVVGVGTLTSSGEARRAWLWFGVVCDAGDAGAAALGWRDGSVKRTAALNVGLPPVIAVVLGALAARRA